MTITFMLFLAAVQHRSVEADMQKDRETLKQMSNLVESELRFANQFEGGYTRIFVLPATLKGDPYDMQIANQEDLIIRYHNQEYVTFLDSFVIGEPRKGKNVIRKLSGNLYLNTGLASYTITVDGNQSDWVDLGVPPLAESFSSCEGTTNDSTSNAEQHAELRNAYAWNNNTYLFFKINYEYNESPNTFDYEDDCPGSASTSSCIDTVILINTDQDKDTGFRNDNSLYKLPSSVDADFFILDIEGTMLSDGLFPGSGETNWDGFGLYKYLNSSQNHRRRYEYGTDPYEDLVLVSNENGTINESNYDGSYSSPTGFLNVEYCFNITNNRRSFTIKKIGFYVHDLGDASDFNYSFRLIHPSVPNLLQDPRASGTCAAKVDPNPYFLICDTDMSDSSIRNSDFFFICIGRDDGEAYRLYTDGTNRRDAMYWDPGNHPTNPGDPYWSIKRDFWAYFIQYEVPKSKFVAVVDPKGNFVELEVPLNVMGLNPEEEIDILVTGRHNDNVDQIPWCNLANPILPVLSMGGDSYEIH